MNVYLTGEEPPSAPKSVFDRIQTQAQTAPQHPKQNVRNGLFGTSTQGGQGLQGQGQGRGSAPITVRVEVGNSGARGLVQPFGGRAQALVQPFDSNPRSQGNQGNQGFQALLGTQGSQAGNPRFLHRTEPEERPEMPAQKKVANFIGGGGGGGGGGKKGAKGRGADRGPTERAPRRTGNDANGGKAAAAPVDLDADLDAYFSKR
jgi:hypothetical protein